MVDPWYPGAVRLEVLHRQTMECVGERAAGMRDVGALERTLTRPRRLLRFAGADPCHQAAVLGLALIEEAPILDGNAPTAVVAVCFFLERNRRPYAGDPGELLAGLVAAAGAPAPEREAAVDRVAALLRAKSGPVLADGDEAGAQR